MQFSFSKLRAYRRLPDSARLRLREVSVSLRCVSFSNRAGASSLYDTSFTRAIWSYRTTSSFGVSNCSVSFPTLRIQMTVTVPFSVHSRPHSSIQRFLFGLSSFTLFLFTLLYLSFLRLDLSTLVKSRCLVLCFNRVSVFGLQSHLPSFNIGRMFIVLTLLACFFMFVDDLRSVFNLSEDHLVHLRVVPFQPFRQGRAANGGDADGRDANGSAPYPSGAPFSGNSVHA